MPGKHIFKWFLWSETLIVKTYYTNAVCFDDLSRAQFGPDKAEATVGTSVSLPALRGRRTAPTRSPLTSTVIINLVNYACAAYSALVLPRYRSTDHMYCYEISTNQRIGFLSFGCVQVFQVLGEF
ncbi:hypothetical protein Zmor_000582 [Zophobas morio]|uniref:Uncharacterized protein n=1 Tax=Zophobas morio TaxID=2755281 RepID=A0AA38IX33_9CUCU|nr:hypothetical protein Zmor_000582 [Zophobas morio]